MNLPQLRKPLPEPGAVGLPSDHRPHGMRFGVQFVERCAEADAISRAARILGVHPGRLLIVRGHYEPKLSDMARQWFYHAEGFMVYAPPVEE